MSRSGVELDMYSREYGLTEAHMSRQGAEEQDLYGREYVQQGISRKQQSGKVKSVGADFGYSVREPVTDKYSREYVTTGFALNTMLEYKAETKEQDRYTREYGRSMVPEKQPIGEMVSKQIPEPLHVRSESVGVGQKEIPAKDEAQPSIFDKISDFLHEILGSK